MNVQEHVPLAPLTTLGVGGEARFFTEARTEEDIEDAFAFAHERGLPLFVLGGGSNILVLDEGVEGMVLKIAMRDIAIEDEGDGILIRAGAGALWDDIVDEAGARGAFGIENLAGIPGTLAGAAVQNIGAYGAEFSAVFIHADVIDGVTRAKRRIARADAAFAYRTSFFKKHPNIIICRVALRLAKHAVPNLAYPDVVRAHAAHVPLATPSDIACAIRAIRAKKFPTVSGEGTAGSFFKNPVVSAETAASLMERFPGLPAFPQGDGTVKLPLAWLLDHALSLKGYAKGFVRLYEEQPLVIVARKGATATDVDAFARDVATRVLAVTGISIEREVETFGKKVFA